MVTYSEKKFLEKFGEIHYLCIMDNKSYISQEDLDKFLLYLKLKKKWNYYLIIYNLAYSDKTYVELQRGDVSELLIPEDIPYPIKNPFLINICGVNTHLKIHQNFCGIVGPRFSTRLFRQKFTMDGNVYYGRIKKGRIPLMGIDKCYIYVLKHSHRNLTISNLLSDKKVGISTNVNKRTKLLTLGPVGIEIVKLWETTNHKAKKLEKKIHKKLKYRNLTGEWFSDESGDLIQIVENIISKKL
jgi:hypothetical protein